MKKLSFSLAVLLICAMFIGAQAKLLKHKLQPPEFMSNGVNGVLQSLAGDWTGKGTMWDMKMRKNMPWTENVSSKATLGDKFLSMASSSPASSFQGNGFMTYNAQENEYSLTWFDTDGFDGKFEGKKTGNTIVLDHKWRHKPFMRLTMTLDGPNQYRLNLTAMHPGKQPMTLLDATYTRNGMSPTGY